jgi:hypothetical protein
MKASSSGYKLQPGSMPPVVIGGIGGSGTRLIAHCIRELGFSLSGELNEANDNLWFTLLFKRIEILNATEREFDELVEIFLNKMTGRGRLTHAQVELINELALYDRDRTQQTKDWLQARARSLLSEEENVSRTSNWGWKEPNSHIVLDRLLARISGMKYIHVARNGLDMAYSSNQNQLMLWGPHFISEGSQTSPYYSLKYWCFAHRRVLDIGKLMGENFLFLNFDDFCTNPAKGLEGLCDFLGVAPTFEQKQTLIQSVQPPESIGRFKQHDIDAFDMADVEYVKELNFDIGTDTGSNR